MMQACNEHSGGNTDGFQGIVVLLFFLVCSIAVELCEDGDQIGGIFQKGFQGNRSQVFKIFDPFPGRFIAVELLLNLFSCFANLPFDGWVRHNNKPPGLLVGAARGCARGAKTVFDDASINRF